ncbi:MAG: hypothetical protein A4E53_04115 [Pelotomaculum sp. PtaB.Bin104]|nr:MAG: hypothetical protein A4E53_04115 [Pelotomaculum sp. PtaB.Bin104]
MDMIMILLKNIILSTLHGWVGASLAVFMFFRPLKPWRIGRVKIWQGVIPAQQQRIAGAVSDVVVKDLITPQALQDYLVQGQALERKVQPIIHDLVETVAGAEYPTVDSIFPPLAAGLKEDIKDRAKDALARLAEKYIYDPEVETWIKAFIHRRLKQHWQKKLGELWPEDRAAAFCDRILGGMTEYLSGPEFKEMAIKLIERLHRSLCRQTMPLRAALPRPLQRQVAAWPALLVQVLPELVCRLQNNPEVQEKLTSVILDIMEQLKEKSPLARVGIGLYQFFNEYRADVEHFVRHDMFPRLGEFLASPEVKLWLEQYIQEQADRILDRPVGELAAGIDSGQRQQAAEWIADHLGGWLAGAGMQAWLGEFLKGRYSALSGFTAEELLERYSGLRPQEVEAALLRQGIGLVRRPATIRLVRMTARSLIDEIASYPVGRLKDHLPPETLAKFEAVSVGLVSAYLKNKIPAFLEGLDLKGIVQGRIESYSPRELVDMFQRVTMNNLQKIEIYGAVIGAAMGVFFGLANLHAGAFWFIAGILILIIGLIRWESRN